MEYICANCRNPVKVTPSARMPNHRLVVDECEHCLENRVADLKEEIRKVREEAEEAIQAERKKKRRIIA